MSKSLYGAHVPEQARKLCLLGATDPDLADFFGVSRDTINEWKNAHPEFLVAITAGKDAADAEVADSLFRRAKGYSHPAVKIMAVAGRVEEIPYTEHYPPDTVACIYWLKNRQRKSRRWLDKPEGDVEGGVGGVVVTGGLPE